MRELVFSREIAYIPEVFREDGELRVQIAAGTDSNHDLRRFTFPISETHLEVLRADLTRHLLLWSAILPLCTAAGSQGPLDESAAVSLLGTILFGSPDDVESLFRDIHWNMGPLLAQGADIELLKRGELFVALGSETVRSEWYRFEVYPADPTRARRIVRFSPLDVALLKYTGRYLYSGKMPTRQPDAVDPELLPEVMQVIASAEQACAGMRLSPDSREGMRFLRQKRKQELRERQRSEWQQIKQNVEREVRRAHPELVDDAVHTVSFLMCSEAADRARAF